MRSAAGQLTQAVQQRKGAMLQHAGAVQGVLGALGQAEAAKRQEGVGQARAAAGRASKLVSRRGPCCLGPGAIGWRARRCGAWAPRRWVPGWGGTGKWWIGGLNGEALMV